MSSSESARSALEEQDLNKIITKTTTYAYGGPDGTRTRDLRRDRPAF